MLNHNYQNQIKQIEKELLQIIINNLKNNQIKLDETKQNTKDFLSLLSFSSFENLKQKIGKFDLKHFLYQKFTFKF